MKPTFLNWLRLKSSYTLPHGLVSYSLFPAQSFVYIAKVTILLDALINSNQIASYRLQSLFKTMLHSTNKLISLIHFSHTPSFLRSFQSSSVASNIKSILFSHAFKVPPQTESLFSLTWLPLLPSMNPFYWWISAYLFIYFYISTHPVINFCF